MPADTGTERPRPRDFLRRRRPEYFSDTPNSNTPRIDRAVLEFHLSTLTSRSEELAFEKFALALCKLVVAPNLVPHTGPTGGGDSKVDTETFPVASDLSLDWYVADAEAASQERWGFAFSAKADWKPKVKSDLAKIAATGRSYDRAYFVSNQAIPDKGRSDVEDELRQKHGFDVRIFNRDWILDRVFEGHHEELAVELLAIQTELVAAPRPGPRDASRLQRLGEIDDAIKAGIETAAVGPRIVDLAIESAGLARELERSRDEVEGRLDRAERLAERYGFSEQKAEVAYQEAWTAYWWHEEGAAFARALEEHEGLAASAPGVRGLRRLVTLFYLAATGITGSWTAEPEWLVARRATVDEAIETIASNVTTPSASLTAKVSAALLHLYDDPRHPDTAFEELGRLVDEVAGLLGFDLGELADEVSELGSLVPESAAFDTLHERLVREVQIRAGDFAAGELHTDRAVQLYLAGRYAQAIAAAGRALPLLVGHEARGSMLRALDVIADSYLQMALPWAARSAWLLASTLAGSEAFTSPASLPRLVYVLDRIRSTELSLGRLAQSLSVNRIYSGAAAAAAVDTPDLGDSITAADVAYEAALAYGLMRLPPAALISLSRLPDVLGRAGLEVARSGLLLALGFEDEVSDSLGSPAETHEFLRSLRDMPDGPELDPGQFRPSATHQLTSRVLGVRIVVDHDLGSPATQIAESCLAVLEGLLATGAAHGIIGAVPELRLTIRRGHFTPMPFRIVSSATDDGPKVEVAYAQFDPAALSKAEQELVRVEIRTLMARIMAIGFHLGPVAETLERLFGDERALDRGIGFALSFGAAGDLMGATHERGIEALLDGSERVYEMQSKDHWAQPPPSRRGRTTDGAERDLTSVPHDRMRVARTVIDVPLWDRATWKGVFFATRGSHPPLLAFGFIHEIPARQIWQGWQKAGPLDPQLQVSIVTDVSATRPFDYRVLVAPNWLELRRTNDRAEIVIETIRMHEMNPESDQNLLTFGAAYKDAGGADLGVAILPSGEVSPRDVQLIGSAPISSIVIRSLRELQEGDWEYALVTTPIEG